MVSATWRVNRFSYSSVLAGAAMLGIAAGQPALATVYYVNGASGSDSALGTSPATAWQTLARATQSLDPGDVVNVAGGVYNESLELARSGTPGNPISIIGDPNNHPAIISTGNGATVNASYAQISGFDITAPSAIGISIVSGNHHVTLSGNVVHGAACSGIGAAQADYITVTGNTLYDNAKTSPAQCSGISIYEPVNVDDAPGTHILINRNLAYGNINLVPLAGKGYTTDGNGIIIDDGRQLQNPTPTPAYTGLVVVEANIMFNNGGRGGHAYQSDNVIFRNNTAYHNVTDPQLLGGAENGEFSAVNAGNIQFYNNIAVPLDGSHHAFDFAQATGVTADFNFSFGGAEFYDFESTFSLGPHNVVDLDPRFVNASINPALADFRLFAGSPALTAGSGPLAATADFSGIPFPSGAVVADGALEQPVSATDAVPALGRYGLIGLALLMAGAGVQLARRLRGA